MKRIILLIGLFLLPATGWSERAPEQQAAVNRATALAFDKKLAERPEWLALLHISRDVLFRRRSSIDDNDFFLHPRGRVDPHAELAATVTAFVTEEVIDDESASCRYPARYEFLSKEMDLPPASACARFESWKEKLAPNAVSMVFSSYYMNNPASIYGHTFLKLSRDDYEDSGPLLDYTINYAATTNTKNGVLFAIRGLMGGYRGQFSTEPYYVKIQKYNNMESRDLWEYRLDMTQAQIDTLVKHLWELGGTSMVYYFFNKNCSYQLLPLLDVARPELGLAKQFRFRAIPLDTLKAVKETPGLVTGENLRPSHTRLMLARRSQLNDTEIRLAEAMVLDPSSAPVKAVAGLEPAQRALVLDSSFHLLRYRSGFYRDQPPAVQALERRILDARRAVPAGIALPPPPIGNVAPPESGHGTGRVGVYAGGDKRKSFQEVTVRGSIHDLEGAAMGYVEGSQLEMFNVRARYQEGPDLYLEEFKLFEIISIAPRDRWIHPPSWTVRAHAAVAHDLEKDPDHSLVTSLDGGSGLSFQLAPGLIGYAMWKGDVEVGDALRKGHRAGAAAHAGLLARAGRAFRVHAFGTATRFFTGDVGNRLELSLIPAYSVTRNFELRANLRRSNGHQEATGGFNLYW